MISQASSDAERAGAALGAGLGMMAMGTIWVIGDVIIGTLYFSQDQRDNHMKKSCLFLATFFGALISLGGSRARKAETKDRGSPHNKQR